MAIRAESLHVTIVGIDGSGKSTITASLPAALAAETESTTGSAGEAFQVTAPEEDHLLPGFDPDGLLTSARLARWFKKKAKRFVDRRKIYPFFKLPQMLLQDHAAFRLGRRYKTAVVVSDGNAMLSATGRAANYLRAASERRSEARPAPTSEDLGTVFRYILEGVPVPAENQKRLPDLGKGRLIYKISRMLGLRGVWLPDFLVFLDLSPSAAMTRIVRRGKVDSHENEADLAQAREMYTRTLEAFQSYRSPEATIRIRIDDMTPGQILREVVAALRPKIAAWQAAQSKPERPLGTSREELTGSAIWKKIFSYRYVVRYLLAKCFQGAWREPTFPLSALGRLFLKEGYSAGVMRVIYDRDEKDYGLMDRVFLEYPLHRGVYDRLQILTRQIESLLETKLKRNERVSIFTAPSGFAYDLFRPLESIARRSPGLMQNVSLLAADLDPHGYLQDELTKRAAASGIPFEFRRGDLTREEVRGEFEKSAPYDLVLFVGLSSWLPKPYLLRHLKWIRSQLKHDGVFVTDSFTPAAYSFSGRYAGYKAHYYTPDVYRALLDYCGFAGLTAQVESGRDAVNHVFVASPLVR